MSSVLEDEFGDIVRKARYGLGIEADEVAEKTGISVERLAALESYQDVPTREESRHLANLLELDDAALWGIVQGWSPPEDLDLKPFRVEVFRFEPMDSNGFIVTHPEVEGALLVDPGGTPERLVAYCKANNGLRAVFLTHTHYDHIDGLPAVVQAYEHVPVYVHAAGAGQLYDGWNVHVVEQDSVLRFDALDVRFMVSPGHSDDGLTIGFDTRFMCIGDTLFAGSLGRSSDGPATYPTLLRSAHRLLKQPADTRLLPGHGPITTVGLEKRHNPFLASQYNKQR